MDKENKISVIMPAYNSEKHIAEAIDSVISQTYTNWELLIVDDGSTDNTGNIIDKYSLKDNRIKAFHVKNSGVSHARNIALDNSTGEWIFFIDSDDFLSNDALEILLKNSIDCDLVIGSCKYYPNDSFFAVAKETKRYDNLEDIGTDFGEYFYAGFFSSVWGKLIKKSKTNNRFDERYQNGEDTLYFSTIINQIRGIRLLTDIVYFYRKDDKSSLSNQYNKTLVDVIENVVKNYIDIFKNEEITSRLESYYMYAVVKSIDILFKLEIDNEEKKKRVLDYLKKEYLHTIHFQKLLLSTDYQRKATLLLIGDIDLIMDEFSKTSIK